MRSILYHLEILRIAGIRMTSLMDRVFRDSALWSAFLGSAAWLIVLSAFAWALSALFWATGGTLSPSPTPRHESDPLKVAAMLAQRLTAGESAPAAAVSSSSVSRMHHHALVGIANGFGASTGFALIESDGNPAQAILLGESLADGQRLVLIGHDHAVLEKDGRDTRLALTPPATKPSERSTSPIASTPVRAR